MFSRSILTLLYFSNGCLPPDIESLLPSDIIFCSANPLLPALLPVCCLVTTHLPSSYSKEPNRAVNQTPSFVYLLEHRLLKQIADAYCPYHMFSNLSCNSTDTSRLYNVRYTPHPPTYSDWQLTASMAIYRTGLRKGNDGINKIEQDCSKKLLGRSSIQTGIICCYWGMNVSSLKLRYCFQYSVQQPFFRGFHRFTPSQINGVVFAMRPVKRFFLRNNTAHLSNN